MITNNHVILWTHLENIILLVISKIPGDDAEDFFLMIHGDDLELIFIHCLYDFDHLSCVA